MEIWFKPLTNAAWAVCFLNRGTNSQDVSFQWSEEQVSDNLSGGNTAFRTTTYTVRDLWAKKDLGNTASALNATIPGHDVLLLRLDRR